MELVLKLNKKQLKIFADLAQMLKIQHYTILYYTILYYTILLMKKWKMKLYLKQ